MGNITSGSFVVNFKMQGTHTAEELKEKWYYWLDPRHLVEFSCADVKIDEIIATESKVDTEIRRVNILKKIISNSLGKEFRMEKSRSTNYRGSGAVVASVYVRGHFTILERPEKPEGSAIRETSGVDVHLDSNNEIHITSWSRDNRVLSVADPEFEKKFKEAWESYKAKPF